MAGVNIGKVVNARLDDHFHAILTLDVKENVKIPDDSSASIVSSSIMGEKYIEIEPGGSIRDEEVFKKAEELGVSLFVGGSRTFRH